MINEKHDFLPYDEEVAKELTEMLFSEGDENRGF